MVTRIAPPEYWVSVADEGVLNREFLSYINCDNSEFSAFRERYTEHLLEGKWNWADEGTWIHDPPTWRMVKEAERILEIWRRQDLWAGPKDNLTVDEALQELRRHATKQPYGIIAPDVVTNIAAMHLERFSQPPGSVTTESFAGRCLLGIIAAIVVFGRALTVLGDGRDLEVGQDDGFTLWRHEFGYLMAGMMLFEGATLLDLTRAPGWPGVDARLVESVLQWKAGKVDLRPHEPQAAENLDAEDLDKLRRHVILGSPRLLQELPPSRLPPLERRHKATDPMGVTKWGHTARLWMAAREARLAAFTRGLQFTVQDVGPAWVQANPAPRLGGLVPEGRKFHLLGLIYSHGALDLEMPSLIEALFPDLVEVRYIVYGERWDTICRTTRDAAAVERLCEEGGAGSEQQSAGGEPEEWRGTVLEGRFLLRPDDPRLTQQQPHLLTVSSWLEAIWATRYFPEVPLILFFGPPLLLSVAKDIKQGHKAVMADFWAGFAQLYDRALSETALIAAESLFRSEQFFYQTGMEVPFLRPMSTWVNATYRPRRLHGQPPVVGEVLVHNRGRLKYESFFISGLQQMAGPKLKYKVVAQGGRVLPFEDLGSFHALVLLPWSPELCFLRNMFKMRVPTFVPARKLLRNMVHISNQRLMPAPYYKPHPHSDRAAIGRAHAYDPFLDTVRPAADPIGVAARAYWAEYSEYLLMPVLRHFEGVADLLVGLQMMEGHKISAQMRAAYLQDMEEMRSFWVDTLARILKHSFET